ncbi:MAG TPA: tetratricopeptide repeat protein [Chromatiales bacterium]|nr:tetratricopeptide repeat protein [Thiotrichales bacterium]HIP68355.1 tetratricopeptide repeat protein [Chromatiales bacterium]
MADYPTTDEEQVEVIKKWWAENGRYLIAGVVLGLAGLFGWNYWQDYTKDRAMQGSTVFAQLQQSIQKKDVTAANDALKLLREKYAATPYAEMGSLAIAGFSATQGDLAAAEENLRWAMEKAKLPEARDVARLRLAAVLNAGKKYQQALDLLEQEALPAVYTSLVEEYRGDALRGLGKLSEARAAYSRALLTAGGRAEYLQWKHDDLGIAGEGAS